MTPCTRSTLFKFNQKQPLQPPSTTTPITPPHPLEASDRVIIDMRPIYSPASISSYPLAADAPTNFHLSQRGAKGTTAKSNYENGAEVQVQFGGEKMKSGRI